MATLTGTGGTGPADFTCDDPQPPSAMASNAAAIEEAGSVMDRALDKHRTFHPSLYENSLAPLPQAVGIADNRG